MRIAATMIVLFARFALKILGSFYLLGKMVTEACRLIMRLHVREINLKMNSGAFYIPKGGKLSPLGEDAHFICAEEQTIGVADGVGGWCKMGIDSGLYARELMTNCIIAVQDQFNGAVDPGKALEEGHLNTNFVGSSTACIITLDGNRLRAVNLGDSRFMVVRGQKVKYISPVQQHSFNHPFQLGKYSLFDQPSSAEKLMFTVKSGDVVVAGTDGLFDNMYPVDIMNAVNNGIKENMEPERVAWNIAQLALFNSEDRFANTPYSTAAREAGRRHPGGKRDDITVVVAYIVQNM